MSQEKVDEHPWRTLAIFLASGTSIFTLGLSILLGVLIYFGGLRFDQSILYFYPLLAGAGALFGFERWVYYESGGVNPFHDH